MSKPLIVTDVEHKMKFCTWHPELKPSYALLDPEITVSLPTNMTAWTGIDALVHAIEADCAAAIAGNAIQDIAASTNPRALSVAEIQGVVEDVLGHGR